MPLATQLNENLSLSVHPSIHLSIHTSTYPPIHLPTYLPRLTGNLCLCLSWQQLESAVPLATHLNENLSEVEAWLEEMEAELRAQGQPGDNLEEVKKQHDHLKVRDWNLRCTTASRYWGRSLYDHLKVLETFVVRPWVFSQGAGSTRGGWGWWAAWERSRSSTTTSRYGLW